MSFYLQDCGLVCALGVGKEAVRQALFSPTGPSGVAEHPSWGWVGAINHPVDSLQDLPVAYRSRNNGLLRLALAEIRPSVDAAVQAFGAGRVAVVIGTSTSGILEGEVAMRRHAEHGRWPATYHYQQQEMNSPADFVARESGALGPAYVISVACASGAKALAAAARLLHAGLADAVIAGGADALCDLTVRGFSALAAVAPSRCNPLSAQRRGINVREAACLFLLSRQPAAVRLAGWGETADAHHISAPEPSGVAAASAMQGAVQRAQIAPRDIDYVNLHGTATLLNDAMESRALAASLPADIPVSSTKPLTGHALGAAGAIEAGFAWLTLHNNPRGQLPPHWWDGAFDLQLPRLRPVVPGEALGHAAHYVLSSSFAFGGSNAVLVLGGE